MRAPRNLRGRQVHRAGNMPLFPRRVATRVDEYEILIRLQCRMHIGDVRFVGEFGGEVSDGLLLSLHATNTMRSSSRIEDENP